MTSAPPRPDPPAGELVTLLDRAADVIAVVDEAGRITYVNETVTTLLAWAPAELVGSEALGLVHPDDIAVAGPALAAELDGSADLPPLEVRIRSRDDAYFWFEVLSSGWIDVAGMNGVVINLRESTGRHRLAERAARRAELDGLVFDVSRRALDATLADVKQALPGILAQLGSLLRAGRASVVVFDSSTGAATGVGAWPPDSALPAGHLPVGAIALERIQTVLAGLESGELLGGPDVDQDDGAEVTGASVFCPLVVARQLLGVLVVEHGDDGQEWMHDEATAIRSVGDAIAIALARDNDRRALVAREEQFRLIAANASDAITLLDPDGRCTYASPSAVTVLRTDPADLVGADLFEHVHPDDRDTARRRLAAFAGGDDVAVAITYRWVPPPGRRETPDDGPLWIENVFRAVRDPDTGETEAIQGSARDVTARKAREDELAHRALHDPLTGVANRTLFVERLAGAVRARRQGGAPFAVLAIDLDGFKEVNDTYGHLEGDRALVTVAERLAAGVRQADTVGRIGGDEFVVLCREATEADALALAERLVRALGEPVAVVGGTATMSASIGVAPAVESDPSLESILGAADLAMYEAKRAGKSCVRLRKV